MLHALIMAGGAGTRFWPVSRKQSPKQLLPLAGARTMIQETVDRLRGFTPPDRLMILTNHVLVEPIERQLPELPAGAVIGEPCKRDTAPCVGLAAMLLAHRDPEAVMLVLPADQLIRPVEAFEQAVSTAVQLVAKDPRRFITLGIPPTYPAEAFGYIERGEEIATGPPRAFKVKRFREKPDAKTAEQFLSQGGFYWNAGIFCWRADSVLAALARFEPEMFSHLKKIAEAFDRPDYSEVLAREFAAITGRSIDYAIMEKYEHTAMVETAFQWDDVGSWEAWKRFHETDASGNTSQAGRTLLIDASENIVRSEAGHTVVAVGVSNLIIVQTPDATLVADRANEESLRAVTKKLAELGWDDLL